MEVHHHPHVEKKRFREYFLEFLMIFLAVTMGFFAESLRERIVDNEKENTFMKSMVKDLEEDTAYAGRVRSFHALISRKIDSALKIPVERLREIGAQDSFYHYFLFFYAWVSGFTPNDNTITQLKNAGGFNVVRKRAVIDSINTLNIFSEGPLKGNRDAYIGGWQRLNEFAIQMIILPKCPDNINDSIYTVFPRHLEVFTRYDRPLLQQLYSFIRLEQSGIETNMNDEVRYRNWAGRLIDLIRKEYSIN